MNTFHALTVGTKFDQGRHNAAIKLFGSLNKTGNKTAWTDSRAPRGGVDITSLVSHDEPQQQQQQQQHSKSSSSPAHDIALPQLSMTLDIFGRNDGSGSHDGSANRADTDGCQGKSNPSEESAVDKPLKPMSLKKMRNLWRKHELDVMGVDVPAPIEHFSDLVRPPLNTPRHVVTNLFERHHRVPTPIQMQAIPALIQHRHVLACAPTGSGKTIAFLIPLFALLAQPDPTAGVRALIITPTVELAHQIEREAFFLTKGQRWRFVQHGQTTRNKDMFISTPGRVVSLVQQQLLTLSSVRYLVFDEGDRLWDEKTDFLSLVDAILAACTSPDKVVCLFTATLSERVEQAARSVMGSDPVRILVRGRQTVNRHIAQKLVFCTNEIGKVVAMRQLIREGIHPPVLIFVQSIERTKELYEEIRAQGLHMALMNAKMSVEERDDMVTQFRLGSIWILVTTELLSRGIDFKNVNTVINFDFPTTVDSYIHRVGRTGRAGKTGQAITFFTEDDKERLPGIAKVMKESGSAVEEWMLGIKVDRATRQRLERSTPHRTIVSTRKRMLVADQRLERQYRRLETEQKLKESKKKAAREKRVSEAKCASNASTVEAAELEDNA